MLRNSRLQPWYVLISLFALIGHLLLPAVHAQTWAKRDGNPLLLALCGSSPEVLAKLRSVAPPELMQRLDQDHAGNNKQSCGHDSIYSAHLAASSQPPVQDWSSFRHVYVARSVGDTPRVHLVRRAQARAPPLLSRFEASALSLS